FLQVPEQLELRRRRSHDENLSGRGERSRDLVEEPLGIVGMFLAAFRSFRMTVVDMSRSVYRRFVDSVRLNVKDMGFLVIDPDRYVLVHERYFSWRQIDVWSLGRAWFMPTMRKRSDPGQHGGNGAFIAATAHAPRTNT